MTEWFVEDVCKNKDNAVEEMLAEIKKRFFVSHEILPENIKDMISKMEDGDVIRFYRSPNLTWMQLAGRAGYELMRGETAIDTVLICYN